MINKIKNYFQRYRSKRQKLTAHSMRLLTLLLLTAYSVLPVAVKSQQYPVKLVPVVIPPYSVRIGDYATSTDNKLQLQVLMTDLLEPQHQTGIKFSLEAGLNAVPLAKSNNFITGMNPFMLYPGNNITLTNVDLRSLFELQNLSGINAVQYSKPLSDGVYQFCFQAYDYYTKNNLSAKTCAPVFLVQYDPPMLTLPQNAEKVQALSPYTGGAGIVFQWMPRQIAPNTRYVFTLKELWDMGQSPVSGFLSAPALWTEETYAPTLYYGIDKTQLIPGKRYAWQVQAKSGNPVLGANPTDDNGVYKNNGLSEIYYFDYVENCAVPALLTAKNVGRGRVELNWSIAGQPAGLYNVQYRKKASTAEWVTQQSYQPSAILTGLEDQTEYEYRIGSVCGNVQTFNNTNPSENGNSGGNAYSYSGVQYFTTDSNDVDNNYQCGIMPAIDIANKTPLQTQLGINEVFMAGDFPVTVIASQGSGVYSGIGYIVVPYLANTKIKVTFNNIQLNTDKKLIAGEIETAYDPEEKGVHSVSGGLGEIFGDAGVKDVTVKYVITDIQYTATPPPGKITIYGDFGTGGEASQEDYPGGKDYEIKDKDGNIWTVDEEGNVTKVGKVAEGGASNSNNTAGVTGSGSSASVNQYTAKGITIQWEKDSKGKFAYDTPEKKQLPESKYPSVKDAENNTVYVPYKATVNKQTELFDAKVKITDPALKDAKIIFKTLGSGKGINATELNKTDTERTYQLKLVGSFDYAEEEVLAVLMPADTIAKQQVISSFRLIHLSPKTVNVSMVPLDSDSQSKLQAQSDKINQIYSRIGVTFNVKQEPVLNISSIVSGNTISSEDSDLMSTYSPQQQQINALYKGTDARYVLFVTNKSSSKAQNGYMRLNGQFGYVFNNALQKTGAHELGHGVFNLEHPWKVNQTPKGSTDLLMDSSIGEEFSHLDWKQVNDPALKLYVFQSQAQGEDRNGDGIDLLGNIIVKVKQDANDLSKHLIVGQLDNNKPYVRSGYDVYDISNGTVKDDTRISYTAIERNGAVVYETGNGVKFPYDIELSTKGNAVIKGLDPSTSCSFKYQTINWEKPSGKTSAEVLTLITAKIDPSKWQYQELFNKTCNDDIDQFYKNTIGNGGIECLRRSAARAKEVIKKSPSPAGLGLALYTGGLEYGICMSEEDKLNAGDSYLTKFSYGFVNEFLHTIDVDAMASGITKIAVEKLIKDIKCLTDKRGTTLMIVGQNQNQLQYMYECMGVVSPQEVTKYNQLITAAWDWAKKNYTNPYVQGKATFFIASIVVPVIGEAKLLRTEKLLATVEKTEPYYNDFVKLSNDLKGKTVDEAVDILKGKDIVIVYKGIKYEDFIATVGDFAGGAKEDLAKQAYKLWGEEKWSDLEKLFKDNNLNGGWPPFNGAKSIEKVEMSSQLVGKVFDRFQVGKYADGLGGSFASPVLNSTEGVADLVFTYDSRALANKIKEGTYYYKFRIKDDVPGLFFEYGEAIPWFEYMGTADQVKSSSKFNDILDHIEIIEKLKFEGGKWINVKK
ncbi:fibronectin type III domain-containing protein [Chryseobacterium aureum]|uniref:fibronectin type III domain-containing protein n=1 Tax=Chryseobacterium aureum TaxID=2497456 RepID=UPI000F87083A|nr:fibronectin type III domain-containing protein [Chryseobacterium aureum]